MVAHLAATGQLGLLDATEVRVRRPAGWAVRAPLRSCGPAPITAVNSASINAW